MSFLTDGLEIVFKERKHFIIIGLTGRTGSGCSTVGDILLKNTYDDLSLSKDVYKRKSEADKLRFEMVDNYIKYNWSKYYVVRIKDILTSFILEESLDKFADFCSSHLNISCEEFKERFSQFLLKNFDEMHKIRLDVQKMFNENNDEALRNDIVYNFYFKELPIFTNNIKEYLDTLNANGFTTIYQKFGNNIRTSGNPYISTFNPENIFLLSQRTNALIKILRKRSLQDKTKVLVAIDSIRNPYEASFFRERYSSFYLFAITTDNKTRIDRLSTTLSKQQIARVDEAEYPNKLTGFNKFTSLNVQRCIEMADVHIFNPNSNNKDRSELTWKLIKYVALINHPGLVNPSTEERLMQLAYNAKLSSGCISRQVGAVVTDGDYSVKAIGWNDVPRGQVPCVLRNAELLVKNSNKEIFSDYENEDTFIDCITGLFEGKNDRESLKGCNLSYCFKDIQNYMDGEKNQVHTRALHAEENAFLQISKYGGSGVLNGNLFTTASPCELCSKKAYQLGIKTIYYIDPYPGISESHILGSGAVRPKLKLFEGAIGRAYHQLFEPIMPNKDVVDLLVNIDIPSKKKLLEKEINELNDLIEIKEHEILKLAATIPPKP